MNNDLNTAKTASPPLLVGADRKDPLEKWVLPMVRSCWTFCLVVLRRVRDAWVRRDIMVFPEMRESYERRKAELFALKGKFNKDTPFAECPLDYLIYHRLVHGERNIAVHEIEQTYSDPWTFLGPEGSFDLGDIYLPMGDIDLWGDWDCRDWLKKGIDWWRKEIAAYTKDCFKQA